MGFITCVFLLIVGFFLWRGYRNGLLVSLGQILSLLIAYPAAIFFTNPLANFIFSHTHFTGMLVYFAAGSAIFLGVGLLVTSLLKAIARLFPHSDAVASGARLGGAAIGGLMGVAVGLLAVYAIDLSQQTASNTAAATAPAQQQPAGDTLIEAGAKALVSTAAATAVDFVFQDKTATHIAKTFTENPQKVLAHIQKLSQDGELKALMDDGEIQALLKSGDSQALLNNWKFQNLMNNQDMQAILVNSEDTKDGRSSQEVAAEKMIAAWQRSDAIKNDPRVLAIISDPEFQQQLNSPNKLALMLNPKLKELTDIIFSNQYQTASPTNGDQSENSAQQLSSVNKSAAAEPDTTPEEKQKPVIYRWTDSSGKLHYSDGPEKNSKD